jgi:hypothetical protein
VKVLYFLQPRIHEKIALLPKKERMNCAI